MFLEHGDGGNIITVSSAGGSHQAAGVVYGASKAAVNAMVRHMAFATKRSAVTPLLPEE